MNFINTRFILHAICLSLNFVIHSVKSIPKLESGMLHSLQYKPFVNILATMKNSTKSVLNEIETLQFNNRIDKLDALALALQEHAFLCQERVLRALERFPSITVESYWVSNQISVLRADGDVIHVLHSFEEIGEIRRQFIIPLEDITAEPELLSSKSSPSSNSSSVSDDHKQISLEKPITTSWGIARIQAPSVWVLHDGKNSNGSNVRVATIDSGVRVTHEALRNNYAGNVNRNDSVFAWYDPYTKSKDPEDLAGHGTHTMGTFVGHGGIGVAPGASWMSCRGCYRNSCQERALLACGQFLMCPHGTSGPTNGSDCSQSPRIVSNSWGGGRGHKYFNAVISAWQVADIIPFFSIGNSGPACFTANSPGDQEGVISVGATEITGNHLLGSSSRGPDVRNTSHILPYISAPGRNINSSIHTGDKSYVRFSGTSMAAPHAAGTAALLLSHNPNLTFANIREIFAKTAVHPDPNDGITNPSLLSSCAGIRDDNFPNNNYGFGIVNAFQAYSRLLAQGQ